ncbi:hypothetical protein ASG12_15400 [Williamsia sp. Leaf354]|uniref:hypothetical protein n=1 Tax=Williamsia sp. Leaf354 TaxID=1736349 RepID=UPI0006FF3AB2|nr:hypothetical protein [Williamsia sp. Leaf354]KQR97329.1 hypothetical protein ASG12_15400 [Williamsia sp. Leaf354]
MHLPRILGTAFAALLLTGVGAAGAIGVAHADTVEPVSRLIAAGVPADVAVLAPFATPAAGQTINLNNRGNPGQNIDAVIDHDRATITVIQRWLQYERSRLTVGWVNLATGRSGVTGLPRALPGRTAPPASYPTVDRAVDLPTGRGPVAIVVYGEIPGEVGLIGLSSEAYGYLTPIVRLLQV